MYFKMECMIFTKASSNEEKNFTTSEGVVISRDNYDKLREKFSAETIDILKGEHINKILDGNEEIIDNEIKYILVDSYKSPLGTITTKERIVDPKNIDSEIKKIKNKNSFSLLSNSNLFNCTIHGPEYSTAMKKMSIYSIKSSSSTEKQANMKCTWLTIPKIRSYDIIAIRFGQVNGLSIIHCNNTNGKQIWDNHTINYLANGNNTTIKTGNADKGYGGIGIAMNIKDEVKKKLSMELNVVYNITSNKAYKVFGTYQHATSNVDKPSYKFSPSGMGEVISFDNKNVAVKYDNTSSVSALGSR